MLLIPTSLDSGFYFEFAQPLLWTIVLYCDLTVGAYCLWDVLMSLLFGQRVAPSRWLWLSSALALLVSGGLSSTLMYGPVDFNADSADWISTSWGSVFGDLCLAAFAMVAPVVLALRVVDAVRANRSGRGSYLTWRLLGLCVAVRYGVLLALNSEYGVMGDAALIANIVLSVAALGSLLASATVRLMRRGDAGQPQPQSV